MSFADGSIRFEYATDAEDAGTVWMWWYSKQVGGVNVELLPNSDSGMELFCEVKNDACWAVTLDDPDEALVQINRQLCEAGWPQITKEEWMRAMRPLGVEYPL